MMRKLLFCLTAGIPVLISAASFAGFSAYNDLGWESGEGTNKITVYDVLSPTSGALRRYADGVGLSVSVNISNTSATKSLASTADNNAAAGTEANALFSGIVDCDTYSSWSDGTVTMTFTGLNASKPYELAVFGNRAEPTYANHWLDVMIKDVSSFQNRSTPGAVISTTTLTNDTTRINSGYNTVNGYVHRYSCINPGSDGDMAFDMPFVTGGAYANAFRLKEIDVAPLKNRQLRITEIMYNPIGGDAYEFLEIKNTGSTSINLAGMYFDAGITCTFASGPTLTPGQITVVVPTVNQFVNRYGGGISIGAYYSSALANGGEQIRLVPNGVTMASVAYDDEKSGDPLAGTRGGWPKTKADGGGHSIVIIDAAADDDDPANWRDSTTANGSPGADDPSPASPTVLINEVIADNLSTTNKGAIYPDWIELYNAAGTATDISGWYMTDGGGAWWQVPSGVSIASHAFLMLWCDTTDGASATYTAGQVMNTGFGLNDKGEGVYLYNPQTNRMDAVSFGLQVGDMSIGRVPDGGSAWSPNNPTPKRANSARAVGSSGSLRLNEWVSNPVSKYLYDWFELYNTDLVNPVPASGFWVCTALDADKMERPLSYMGPGAFMEIIRDDAGNGDSFDIALPTTNGTIAIRTEAGVWIDAVTYSVQNPDESEGRLPDGREQISTFTLTQSPGAANYLSAYTGPRLNEIMAHNRSATTNGVGQYEDWIEIYNHTGSPYDMSGMGLTDDPSAPLKWVFPSGSSLSAGQYIRIWCDGAEPPSTTFSVSDMNCGFALNDDSEGVYLYSGVQKAQFVEYGFQPADLTIGLNASGKWALMASPTPRAANSSTASLASVSSVFINEWMVLPTVGPDWFELYNSSTLPVQVSGLYLTDNAANPTKHQIGELSFIAPKEFALFIADSDPTAGRNHVNFNLVVDTISLNVDILALTRGAGATNHFVADLTWNEEINPDASVGWFTDGQTANKKRFLTTSSPGHSNYLPMENVSAVVINEILTHTDPPLEDAIELHNAGAGAVDIGNWYISQHRDILKKFKIPAGTTIAGGGYKVFYQYQFSGGTGSLIPFELDSAKGETVYLCQGDAGGNLTGYMTSAAVGALINGVSVGRYVSSEGKAHYPPLSRRTFGVDSPSTVTQFRTGTGLANAAPKVGPVVISEIMYNPLNRPYEYVELRNITNTTVYLYDVAHPTNTWKIVGGVTYTFPANLAIPAGEYALVTETADTNAFRSAYGLGSGIKVYGPYAGQLGNSGDGIELQMPDTPQRPTDPDPGYVPYCQVDRVDYDDIAPWPRWADGSGPALERKDLYSFGNDPANWADYVRYGSPAAANNAVAENVDTDGDGMPDPWERAYFVFNFDVSGILPGADSDLDGISNYDEYVLGFSPIVVNSGLGLTLWIEKVGSTLQLRFDSILADTAGYDSLDRHYTIERSLSLTSPSWAPEAGMSDIDATGGTITKTLSGAAGKTYYRCKVELK